MLLGAVASLLQDRAFLLRVLAGRLYLGHASLCFANISESLFHKMQEICYTHIYITVKNKKGGVSVASKDRYRFESKIHVYRATKRMTQQELADLVGVSRQTIMQLERNRYNPSMLLAYSIAKVFDVTIEELFDFSEVEK